LFMFSRSFLILFSLLFFFFFNDTSTPYIYTLSLHDALPIFCFLALAAYIAYESVRDLWSGRPPEHSVPGIILGTLCSGGRPDQRSEEHTSELQSRGHLVCRLLLEKKKKH